MLRFSDENIYCYYNYICPFLLKSHSDVCRWDTLGDIELPKTCFKNPLWESVSEELWPLVAKYWMDSLLVKLEHLFGLLLLLKSITLYVHVVSRPQLNFRIKYFYNYNL